MSKKKDNGLAEVTLACGVEGCPHGEGITSVKRPGALTAEDVKLLNRNRWKQPRLTVAQKKRLQYLLNGTPVCPIHGRQKLGYSVTQKIVAEFDFKLDGEEEGATSAPDLFDDDPPTWETS